MLDSAKLVDYHVSYSRTNGFGYSDAVGCPIFSQAAVLALEPPMEIQEGSHGGFALVQNFQSELWPLPCNYYYQQRYEFYTDGRFHVKAGNFGRGCGNDGIYRLVFRISAGRREQFANGVMGNGPPGRWSNGPINQQTRPCLLPAMATRSPARQQQFCYRSLLGRSQPTPRCLCLCDPASRHNQIRVMLT